MEIEDYDAAKAAEMLWKVISPILIVFGSAGNILVIALLTRKRSRYIPTSVYLSSLAFSDLIVLNTGLMRQWITHTFGIDIREDFSEFGCRFHWFIVYGVTQYSSWMLICVTLERLTSTLLPHRRRVLCTTKSALISVLVILLFLVLLNGHYLFGYGDRIDDGTGRIEKCQPLTDTYNNFILYTWAWIDLCVFFIIPMTILLVGNSLIVNNVITSHRKSRRSVMPSIESRTNNRKNKQQTSKISSLTISLMLVSVLFCICITPIVVYPIGQPYWETGASNKKKATLFLIETLANLLMYVNHSINFILYFMSGKRFRNEVKQLFCKMKVYPDTEASAVPSRSNCKTLPNSTPN